MVLSPALLWATETGKGAPENMVLGGKLQSENVTHANNCKRANFQSTWVNIQNVDI